MFKNILVLVVFLVCGCDTEDMKNEFNNKSEYSILQYYEFEYREAKNDRPYLVFNKALDTDKTVVAFPIKGKTKGYVVMLVNTDGAPKVKVMPDSDFVVTQSTYSIVKEEVSFSEDVNRFIVAHIQGR